MSLRCVHYIYGLSCSISDKFTGKKTKKIEFNGEIFKIPYDDIPALEKALKAASIMW